MAIAVLGVLATLGVGNGAELLARGRLDAATRAMERGIRRARAQALRSQRSCGLNLLNPSSNRGGLEPCQVSIEPLPEGVELQHNFPEQLRVTANGLVLDGGTAVFSSAGTSWRRCLVMSLPLGVVRLGRMGDRGCEADQ